MSGGDSTPIASRPRLYVAVDGQGPVLLLAHGFGGSARNFNPQVRALRPRLRLVRYDARGHARSEAPRDPAAYSPEVFVDDMRAALDAAGAEAAIVGGLSMGAATALRFALTEPERVRGVLLASYPAEPDDPAGFAAVASRFADAIEREGLEAAGRRFVWGPGSGLDPAAAALVRRGFLEHPPHGLAHVLRGVLARQPTLDVLAPLLPGLDRPVLVMVGARDRGSRPPSERLARLLPRVRLVVLPDAGHVVNLQQPESFNAAVLEWLAREGLDRDDP